LFLGICWLLPKKLPGTQAWLQVKPASQQMWLTNVDPKIPNKNKNSRQNNSKDTNQQFEVGATNTTQAKTIQHSSSSVNKEEVRLLCLRRMLSKRRHKDTKYSSDRKISPQRSE
jgi:hypothetical protein